MSPLLAQFVAEARDFLQSISESLMKLETNPQDAKIIDELFRSVHTLKGNSGLFEFLAMTSILHASEDLMDCVRDNEINFKPEIADKLLDAMDFVAQLIDDIEQDCYQPSRYASTAELLANNIRQYLPGASSAALTESSTAEFSTAELSTAVLSLEEQGAQLGSLYMASNSQFQQLFLHVPEEIRLAEATGHPFFVVYQPEPECFFKGEDPFHLMLGLPNIIWGAVLYNEDPRVDNFDCYRSSASYIALSHAPHAELEQHFRYVPEQVNIIAVSDLQQTTPALGRPNLKRDMLILDSATLAVLQAQRDILTIHDQQPWSAGRAESALNTVGAVLSQHEPQLDQFNELKEPVKNGSAGLEGSENNQIIVDWLDALMGSTPAASEPELLPAPELERSDLVLDGASSDSADVLNSMDGEANSTRRQDDNSAGKVLKVEQGKIDRLMDLIGEIVVAKNGLPYLADKAEEQYGVRELAKEIKMQYAVINRIAEELQDAIMQVRMMPVSFIFQRFPRLVRDIARKLNKEVELVIEGEETEADKNIIESLADPLIHLVRNSLDHGLESPEVRQALGKPRSGRLRISASQESDRVIIQVKDDGKGIDPQVIKQKAYQKGIISEEQLEVLSDQDAIQLIFAAGFSTAEKITDLSGRGVGMDVVRSAIQKVGGQVRLDSEVNKGTTLTLQLPLSMAVTNVMVVASDDQIFGIPMDLVVETVRLPVSEIQSIKKKSTTVLRGNIVPIISMNSVLGIEKEQIKNDEQEFAMLVVKSQGGVIGVLVDDFSEVIDIILKPLPGELSKMPIYSGSALLGDGSVLLVLDPQEFA